ncbi:MAG: FixH family protein [Bacteroidetes bacterium]|nr:FixH family protein [Bacteroidota bacterium]
MSTMKINWGARIAILYLGFVALVVTLVFMSMKHDTQLVTKDYYQDEIKYQEVIDAGKNQAALSSPVGFSVNNENVTILLPVEFSDKIVKGDVQFYSAVNAAWDEHFPIDGQSTTFIIPRSKLHPTRYKVKLRWESEAKTYYQETDLNLYRQ